MIHYKRILYVKLKGSILFNHAKKKLKNLLILKINVKNLVFLKIQIFPRNCNISLNFNISHQIFLPFSRQFNHLGPLVQFELFQIWECWNLNRIQQQNLLLYFRNSNLDKIRQNISSSRSTVICITLQIKSPLMAWWIFLIKKRGLLTLWNCH